MFDRHERQSGFTIVELLIVIVVIAILATISLVAYNGIQDRAKSSAALSLAQNVNKSVELYLANSGTYPTIAGMGSATSLMKIESSSFTVSGATPTDETHVRYVQCGTPAIGAQIIYRTFPTGTEDIVIGICS